MINLNVRGAALPNIVVGPAIAYGGIVQLLAGMWEFAAGNTFASWALSSYGGFWISLGIIFTPTFSIVDAYGGQTPAFYEALGLYIYSWMIFTFLVWFATLRSTAVFSLLILTVALAFLCLATGYVYNDGQTPASPSPAWNKAGGGFGIVAGFLAWWAMYSGVADRYNSFFLVPGIALLRSMIDISCLLIGWQSFISHGHPRVEKVVERSANTMTKRQTELLKADVSRSWAM